MSRSAQLLTLLFFALAAGIGISAADTNGPARRTEEKLPDFFSALSEAERLQTNRMTKNLGDAFKFLLKDRDAQNTLVRSITNLLLHSEHPNDLLGFINDLNLRPKVFQAQDSPDDAALGFEYNFSKSLANRVYFEESPNPMGVSFNLNAKGNVAFDSNKNPDDFLESGASLHLFRGFGGIDPRIKRDNAWFEARDRATTLAGEIPQSDNWRDDPRWKKSAEMLTGVITPQTFVDLRAHGTLESDQRFDTMQYVYGAQLGLVHRDWRDVGTIRWLNLLDYPFALVRSLRGEDFEPSGRAIPLLLAGIDLVDPSENDTRLASDSEEDLYPRARFEVTFKTRAIPLKSRDLWFSASYRRFQELGASDSIKEANLDSTDYFVMKLELPYNFNLSYSTGRLPLDRENDQVYALGWDLQF